MERPVKVIESIAAVVDLIDSRDAKSGDPEIGYAWAWYRGQSDESWRLLPGVLREDFLKASRLGSACLEGIPSAWEREVTLNKYFRVLGASYFPSGCSLVDVYLLAQHHSLPTRLLDWTTNPLAALYFAVSGGEEHEEKDGALFAVNPRPFIPESPAVGNPITSRLGSRAAHNSSPNPPKDVATVHDPFVAWIVEYLFGDEQPPETSMVLPLLPDRRAGRIFQQGSCFTLHTPGTADASNRTLEKYIVPKHEKRKLLIQLRRLNITCATLLGDLDNVAKDMKSAFGL